MSQQQGEQRIPPQSYTIIMQQEDDLRALAKIMEFGRAVSIFILVVHVYVYCYPSMSSWHLNLDVIDRILMNFDRTTGIFGCILWTKLMAVLLLAISCMGTIGVKGEKITWQRIWAVLTVGAVLFFMNWWLLDLPFPHEAITALYVVTLAAGYLCLLMAGLWISRLYRHNLMEDVFNMENESFMQETRLMENEYSVNLPTRFQYGGKLNDGWINVVNPFRATIVLGTPGSGKSYAVVNNYIKQMISKGFSVYIYDYKFDDLSTIAYNTLLHNMDKYKVKPHFYVINFDDPHRSHRCNPINPEFMTDISDAYEASYTIMLNLNKTWIEKQGDFFVESPIILLAAIIWYLKIYKNGIYCSFPHAVELLNKPYSDLFTILTSYPELENYLSPFMDAWKGGAQDQLQGQIASAKIPLTRMISPQLYWVMTGNDFSLDINNPKEPKILCVGNNPDRQNIYSAALGLYNSRIVKLINKKGQLKSAVIIDELPTIYFRGLDNLIATARSNKVSVLMGIQEKAQLVQQYGKTGADVIFSVVGNVISGSARSKDTLDWLQNFFGKVKQVKEGVSIADSKTTISINENMDYVIPGSKIANLRTGELVAQVAMDFSEGDDFPRYMYNCRTKMDMKKIKAEEKQYVKIPKVYTFGSIAEREAFLAANYNKIIQDIDLLIQEEAPEAYAKSKENPNGK